MHEHAPFRILILVALLVAAALPACNGTEIPEDFEMSVGEGGGVTGRWTVHRVAGDGQVFLRGMDGDAKDQAVGELSEAKMGELWRMLRDSALMQSPPNEAGNMTRTLTVTANGKRYEARWPLRVGDATTPIDELYQSCRDILAQAQPKN